MLYFYRCQNQQWAGYYSDPEADCHMFHICVHRHDEIEQFSFMCPNQTVFDQRLLVCVWLDNFDCSSAPSLYSVNEGVFEDLENDFEIPETRSQGKSLSPNTFSPEPEERSFVEIENDISSLGKSLSSEGLKSEKTHTKLQIKSEGLKDKATTQSVPNNKVWGSERSYIARKGDAKIESIDEAKVSTGIKNIEETKAALHKDVAKKHESIKLLNKSLETSEKKVKEAFDKGKEINTSNQREIQETQRKKSQTFSTIKSEKNLFSHQRDNKESSKLNLKFKNTSFKENHDDFRVSVLKLPNNTQSSNFDNSKPFDSEDNKKQVNIHLAAKEIPSTIKTTSQAKLSSRLPFTVNRANIKKTSQTHSFQNTANKLGKKIILNNEFKTDRQSLPNKEKLEKISLTQSKDSSKIVAPKKKLFLQTTPSTTSQKLTETQKDSSQSIQGKGTSIQSDTSKSSIEKISIQKSKAKPTLKVSTTASSKSHSTPSKTTTIQKEKSRFASQLFERNENKKEDEILQSQLSQTIPTQTLSRQRNEPKKISEDKSTHVLRNNKAKSLKKEEQHKDENVLKSPQGHRSGILKSIGRIRNDGDLLPSNKQPPKSASPKQQTKTNVNRVQSSPRITSRPSSKFSTSRKSTPRKTHSFGLTEHDILQELLRNVTIIRSKALLNSKFGRSTNIRRNRRVNIQNIDDLQDDIPQKQEDKEFGVNAGLYQTKKSEYIPAASKKLDSSKNSKNFLSSSRKESNKTYTTSPFEIPVPQSKRIYSKYSRGITSQNPNSGRLTKQNIENATSLSAPIPKHKILNIPTKGIPLTIPRIPLVDHYHSRPYISPPFLTSSEEEVPVLIVSRADAESNEQNQKKVYLNTIKADDKKKPSQERFETRLNLEPEKQTTLLPASLPTNPYYTARTPKKKISWADYLNPKKEGLEDRTKQNEDKLSSSSYGHEYRSPKYSGKAYGLLATPPYGLK